MGMFDWIRVACPKCGNILEDQSKAGECMLHDYNITDAPPAVLGDLHGQQIYCGQCQSTWTWHVQVMASLVQYVPKMERDEWSDLKYR